MSSKYTVKEAYYLLRGDVFRDIHDGPSTRNRVVKRVDSLNHGTVMRIFFVDEDGVGGYVERPRRHLVYVVNRVQVVEDERV